MILDYLAPKKWKNAFKRLLVYTGVTCLLTAVCTNQSFAFSSTPEKPQTASVSFGVEYASGKYGTGSTLQSLYMPLIATWSPNERFDIGVELPFIYQNSSNATTGLYHNSLGSTTAKTAVVGTGGSGNGRNYKLQQNRGVSSQNVSSSVDYSSAVSGKPDSDVSGLGDIILRAGYILFVENNAMPQVRTSMFVKTPTASVSDGLGTGEVDFGVGFELSKWFGNLHLAGEVLYNYQGKVSGYGLNDYISYTCTVGYQITSNIRPMLMLKGATAPSTYSDDLLEARARVIWSLTDKISLDIYGSRGITGSTADYGTGVSVIYSF